jgi:hypothetical protein
MLSRRGIFAPDRRLVRMLVLCVAAGFAMAAALVGLEPHLQGLSGVIPAMPQVLPVVVRLAAGVAAYLVVVAAGWALLRRQGAPAKPQ